MSGCKLGMPYMGSKRKLASKIIDKILEDNPNANTLYDLFGGGGAVSFEAKQRPSFHTVHYNELNTGVVELLKDIQLNGITPKYYQWIDRETFNKNKDSDTWLGGLCKVVWSFGNNQKGYLYGKDKEHNKHLCHKLIVDNHKGLSELLSINIELKETTVNERRLELQRFFRLHKLHDKVKGFTCVSPNYGCIRHVSQSLGQVHHLQNLQHTKLKLNITNLSYESVIIPTDPNTIIYLDPPYKNTATYQNDINHDHLIDWIKKQPNKVYISGYDMPSPFMCVAEFDHRSILSGKASNKITEKLYTI